MFGCPGTPTSTNTSSAWGRPNAFQGPQRVSGNKNPTKGATEWRIAWEWPLLAHSRCWCWPGLWRNPRGSLAAIGWFDWCFWSGINMGMTWPFPPPAKPFATTSETVNLKVWISLWWMISSVFRTLELENSPDDGSLILGGFRNGLYKSTTKWLKSKMIERQNPWTLLLPGAQTREIQEASCFSFVRMKGPKVLETDGGCVEKGALLSSNILK